MTKGREEAQGKHGAKGDFEFDTRPLAGSRG